MGRALVDDEHVTLRASEVAVATAIGDETVILDPTSGRYFGLDGVGTKVWGMLQRPITRADLVAAVVAEYDVDEATCEGDLRRLLGELDSKGLIVVADAER